MFGLTFKKKPAVNAATPAPSFHIQIIPEIFYAGNDPTIYHHEIAVGSGRAQVRPARPHLSQQLPKKGLLIGLGSGFFLLILAGISWYYLKDFHRAVPAVPRVAVTPVQPTPNTSTIEDVPIISPTSTITSSTPNTLAPTSTASLAGAPLEFPPVIMIDTSDLDGDALTDLEEEVFGTDPSTWDTDHDGYYDGQEVANLYNPKGFAPVRLIDSGLVSEYVSPVFGYRLYYPLTWQVGNVDAQGTQVLFSALDGDYIEVRTITKEPSQDFTSWFAAHATGEHITDLLQFVNRFEVNLWKRKDSLVGYMVEPDRVYVFIYHPLAETPIHYRHIMEMVMQGFRPEKTNVEIPAQVVLPTTNTSSTPTTTVNTAATTTQTLIKPSATSSLPR